MSKLYANEEQLRYAKRSDLAQEQKIMANYYQDLIRSYGVDITYIRRDTNYPFISGNYNGNQVCGNVDSNIIYGYDTNSTYTLSSSMVTYLEVDNSVIALNSFGVIPTDDVTLYFSINDFAVAFATDIGQYAEYPITPLSGYLPYSTSTITKAFSSDVLYGTLCYPLSGALSGQNIYLEPTPPVSGGNISEISIPIYSHLANPYIAKSFSSDIKGSYYNPNLYISYNKGTYSGHNKLFYSISGYVLYHDLELALKQPLKVKPNVGDIVRLNMINDINQEEYEITEVLSRKPTRTDGLNILLGEYIWKCKAVRRVSSHETIEGSEAQNESGTEFFKDNVLKQQHDKDDIFKEIHDYTNTQDEVYGGYDVLSGLVKEPDVFESDILSGNGILHDFRNNSSLLTDGQNLYYQIEEQYIAITDFDAVEYTETNFPYFSGDNDVMYLKIKNGNIYFTNNTASSAYSVTNTTLVNEKITNFTTINKKPQYSFDRIISNVDNKYGNDGSFSYIFKSEKMAFISRKGKLIAINNYGVEETIAEKT